MIDDLRSMLLNPQVVLLEFGFFQVVKVEEHEGGEDCYKIPESVRIFV